MASSNPVVFKTVAPTEAVILDYLSKLDGVQMSRLLMSLKSPAAQLMMTDVLVSMPPKAVAPAAAGEKAKKALNAFVGFRCYYIRIEAFKPWPMKMLSGPMGVMWESDPNKPLWSLMTKAWSTIRDQIGKDKAPLSRFLDIICPYLNIPAPETYLACFGWEVAIDDKGAPVLSRESTPMPGSFGAGVAATTVSVEDIIIYCQSMGYAQEFAFDTNLTSSTFLGQSLKDLVHDERVAMRNEHRANRQSKRESAVAPVMVLPEAYTMPQVTGDPWAAFRSGADTEATLPTLPF